MGQSRHAAETQLPPPETRLSSSNCATSDVQSIELLKSELRKLAEANQEIMKAFQPRPEAAAKTKESILGSSTSSRISPITVRM